METKEILDNYIYPNLNIEDLLSELNPKNKGKYFTLTCPNCGKKEAFITIKPTLKPIIICNRKNKCAYVSSLWNYLKFSRNLSKKEVLELLAQYSNVDLSEFNQNKTYKNYTPKPTKKILKIKYKKELLSPPTNFLYIDNRKYIDNFPKLDKVTQFKTIITFIYQYSLKTNQSKKIKFYNSRKIENIPDDIGFLSTKDIEILEKKLKVLFPIDTLHNFEIFKNNHFKYNFSEYTIIPSFDINSTQITAIRFRNIYPNKLKELELSFKRIANPLPYGINYEKLNKYNKFYFTEGHIDALSLGVDNFVAIEGVNSFNPQNLGLFLDKEIIIVFDVDEAGIKGSDKFSQILDKLNIKHSIIRWDIKYGKDINEVLQNYNLSFISSIIDV